MDLGEREVAEGKPHLPAELCLDALDRAVRLARVRALVVAVLDDHSRVGRPAHVVDTVLERRDHRLTAGRRAMPHCRRCVTRSSRRQPRRVKVRAGPGEVSSPDDGDCPALSDLSGRRPSRCPTRSRTVRSAGIERDLERSYVLLEVGDRARARNQQHPVVARKQPRQSDLGRRGPVLLSDPQRWRLRRPIAPGPPANADQGGLNLKML